VKFASINYLLAFGEKNAEHMLLNYCELDKLFWGKILNICTSIIIKWAVFFLRKKLSLKIVVVDLITVATHMV